jgi:hypothetical protein
MQVVVGGGSAHRDAVRPDGCRWLLGQLDDHTPHAANNLIARLLQQAARWLICGGDPLLEDDMVIGRESVHRLASTPLDMR